MIYKVQTTKSFDKELEQLDTPVQIRIKSWIDKNLVNTTNPKQYGGPLHGEFKGYWKYRIGQYRIIADIQDSVCTIMMVKVDNRGEVYKK